MKNFLSAIAAKAGLNVGTATGASAGNIDAKNGADASLTFDLDGGSTAGQVVGFNFKDRGTAKWALYKDAANAFIIRESGVADRLKIIGEGVQAGNLTSNGMLKAWKTSGFIPFALQVANTVNAQVYHATIPYPLNLRYWQQAYYVATTHNASNYWTIGLRTLAGTIATFNTYTGTQVANTWYTAAGFNGTYYTDTTAIVMYVDITKVGAPGALYVPPPIVHQTP